MRIGFYWFIRDRGFVGGSVPFSLDRSRINVLPMSEEEFRNHDGIYLTSTYGQPSLGGIANLRLVGFGDVHDTTVLRGVTPMFREFPFEALKAFPGGA